MMKFFAFGARLGHYSANRLIGGLALVLACGLTEGVGLLLLVPLLALIGIGDGGTMPAVLRPLAAMAADHHVTLSLENILGFFILIVGLRAGLVYSRNAVLSKLALDFVDHLRGQLFRAIGQTRWLSLVQRDMAAFSRSLTTDLGRVSQGAQMFMALLARAISAAVHGGIALALAPVPSAITLAVSLLLVFALRDFARRVYQSGRQLTLANTRIHAIIGRFLSGLKLAKSENLQDAHIAAFDHATRRVRAVITDFTTSSQTGQLLLQLGSAIALVVFIYIASQSFALPPGQLLVLVFIFARLLPIMAQLQQNFHTFGNALPAYENALEMIDSLELEKETLPAHPPGRLETVGTLRFRRVSFRYPGQTGGHGGLKSINLTLEGATTTALVGPSGAGKTTLADLAMGLLRPTEGAILVDGKPLTDRLLADWRNSLSYVPQNITLFDGTVRENLIWGIEPPGEAAIGAALEAAAADDFVRRLGNGLETRIGEQGVRLSGGERQRLALARALLRKPLFLVLDEATSALDNESEKRVHEALGNLHGSLMILTIAHRLSSIRHADHILSLDHGRLVEQPTPPDNPPAPGAG